MLDALWNAGDGDIDPDIFDTVKSALALAQDSVSEVILPIGDEPTLDEQAGLALFRKVQGESVKIRAALQGLVQSQSLTRPQPSTQSFFYCRVKFFQFYPGIFTGKPPFHRLGNSISLFLPSCDFHP